MVIPVHAPGNCNGVITVTANGRLGQRASYSNYDNNEAGVQVEIAAPGGTDTQSVLSTLTSGSTTPDPSGYNYVGYNGTSMATPHVTLSTAPKTSLLGQNVTFTVTVTGNAPTGTVLWVMSGLAYMGVATLSSTRTGPRRTPATSKVTARPTSSGATDRPARRQCG
jgi:serine protease